MNRLPLPNWNHPANLRSMGVFPPMDIAYGGLPIVHQPYQHYPPSFITGNQNVFVPRHPLHIDHRQSNFQFSRTNGSSHSHHQQAVPKTNDFSCDVCEKSFRSQQILDGHLQSHVKCDFEGCSFTASRKMLKLHFIQNHAKGRMRIKLETPEEIEKWREQRKKNYPTVANIEKKFAKDKARRESGQIAETKTFRYRGKKRQRNWNRQNQNSQYQKQDTKHGLESKYNERPQCSQHKVQKDDVKELADPLSVLLDSSKNESDEEEEAKVLTTSVPTLSSAPAPVSALASLCGYGGYSSSDENDAEKEVNNNNQDAKPVLVPTPHQLPSQKTEQISQHQITSRKRKQKIQKNNTPQIKRRVTLLEKLLAPEIRHERNVILQCIRYIVNSNYFDAD